jgi:Na+/melibiose symporter-like transporter
LWRPFFAAVAYIYQTDYMDLASRFWLMLIVYLLANLIALPLWTRVVRLFGKHRSWALGLFLNSLCFPPMALLPPGEASFVPTLVLLALAGGTYSVVNVTMPAVLGDIVDHETLRGGINRGVGVMPETIPAPRAGATASLHQEAELP